MSVQKIHLRKLLLLFDASASERIRLLRGDITSDLRKEAKKKIGEKNKGGDFHVPFWAAAKEHVAGEADLREAIPTLIERNDTRERLYPILAEGFLKWWDEKRRWRNEPFIFIPQNVKAQFDVPELKSTIKIENLLALEVVDQFDRIIYPYFDEETVLTAQTARIGLYVLGEALKEYSVQDLRILDVMRSFSFRLADNPLEGNEQKLLLEKYAKVLAEWNALKDEYKK